MSVGSLQAETRVVLSGISWATFESLADSDQARHAVHLRSGVPGNHVSIRRTRAD